MKYFKLRFMSTSGVTNYYTISKDKKRSLELNYNKECIVPERELNNYLEDYNVYSAEYIGQLPVEKEYGIK